MGRSPGASFPTDAWIQEHQAKVVNKDVEMAKQRWVKPALQSYF
jgi:1,6-anhydro-N-acetylmuramate kinase